MKPLWLTISSLMLGFTLSIYLTSPTYIGTGSCILQLACVIYWNTQVVDK